MSSTTEEHSLSWRQSSTSKTSVPFSFCIFSVYLSFFLIFINFNSLTFEKSQNIFKIDNFGLWNTKWLNEISGGAYEIGTPSAPLPSICGRIYFQGPIAKVHDNILPVHWTGCHFATSKTLYLQWVVRYTSRVFERGVSLLHMLHYEIFIIIYQYLNSLVEHNAIRLSTYFFCVSSSYVIEISTLLYTSGHCSGGL